MTTKPPGRRSRLAASASAGDKPRIARVFWSGRSQAVRLPKEFRVDENELVITRRGKALVLEPRRVPVDEKGWPRSFWKLFGQLPSDFDVGNRDQPEERAAPLGEG